MKRKKKNEKIELHLQLNNLLQTNFCLLSSCPVRMPQSRSNSIGTVIQYGFTVTYLRMPRKKKKKAFFELTVAVRPKIIENKNTILS